MTGAHIHDTPRNQPGPKMRWFAEGELNCAWPPCSRPLPAGYYGRKKHVYHCSFRCAQLCLQARKKPIKCAFCGKRYKPFGTSRRARFCIKEHFALWRRRQTDQKKFGTFLGLVNKFLREIIPQYRAPGAERNLRCNLAHFFVYYRRGRKRSLETVSARTISGFLASLSKTRPKSCGPALADLRLFFDWLILTGRRKSLNPVKSKLHSQLTPKYLPHSYSEKELEQIDSLLEASGDPRLQLAVAIGLEAGLQIGEVCELRTSDVDQKKQTLRVPTSRRTGKKRVAFYHSRTKKALKSWLRRRPKVDHDYLLTADRGAPMRKHNLWLHLKKALVGEGRLDGFSLRRLVQTGAARLLPEMDSLSLMASFGWRSERLIERLRLLPSPDSKRAYAQAMDQIVDLKDQPAPHSESLEEHFNVSAQAEVRRRS
jgi:integrase